MKIKEIRENLGLSQKELAKLLGVSPSNVYNYENKRTEPSVDMLKKLSTILDVSVDELLGLDNNGVIPTPGFPLSEEEKAIIKAYRELSFDQQSVIKVQLQVLVEQKA